MIASQVVFGFPEEWEHFRIRQARFLEVLPQLDEAVGRAFKRRLEDSEPIDRFVFLFGRFCLEDFYEILFCCGNGYGTAAKKLLRSFFERVVTLEHLHSHPDELQAFFDYDKITAHKLLAAAVEVLGPAAVDGELLAKAKAARDRVAAEFEVDACKSCGTTRLNHSWNKLDVVSMAKKTRILGRLLITAYYFPLRQSHSSAGSLVERMYDDETGIGFDPSPQRQEADEVLQTAHMIILELLYIQEKHFSLDGLVDTPTDDYKRLHNILE